MSLEKRCDRRLGFAPNASDAAVCSGAMRSCIVGALVIWQLAGCDKLFSQQYSLDAFVCEKTEPDDLDEDGDCIADDVDNCPSTSNTDQSDSNEAASGVAADGVGDACDPHPERSGDTLVFEGFDDPAVAAEQWVKAYGKWSYEVGSILHDDIVEGEAYLLRRQARPEGLVVVVEVGLQSLAFGDRVDGYPELRLFVDDDPVLLARGVTCSVQADRTGGRRDELLLQDNAGGGTAGNLPRLDGSHRVRMRLERRPDLLECEVVVDGVSSPIPPLERVPGVIWPTTRAIGVRPRNSTIRLDWVAIYTAPGA